MTTPGRRPPHRVGLRGLRPRLILAFILVACITGILAILLGYVAYAYLRFTAASLATEQIIPLPRHRSISETLWILAGAVAGLLALIVVLAVTASRRVLRPVRRLANAADRLAQGDLKIRLAVAGADDMTDLVRAFNEMAAALESNVEQLRQTEARARRFAADVSHELRTPLAAMTAVTDVLNDHADDFHGDAATAARLVSRETRNLNRLVEDLIEISRFDAGSAMLVTEDIELGRAIRDCLRVRNWTGEVVTDLPTHGLILRADPRRLDVILANLVGNALRHGAPPVTLAVFVQRRAGVDWVAIQVSDRGAGLAPEAVPHVFERFYKADTARTRSEGSGLGLAIAWENVTLHGGTIEVGNLPHGGAQFTVRLPCDRCGSFQPGPGTPIAP